MKGLITSFTNREGFKEGRSCLGDHLEVNETILKILKEELSTTDRVFMDVALYADSMAWDEMGG